MKAWLKNLFNRKESVAAAEYGNPASAEQLLCFVDAIGATFQISFLLPLAEDLRSGRLFIKVYTHSDVSSFVSEGRVSQLWHELERFEPKAVVFSRYGGGLCKELVEFFRARRKKIIFHLDDNLYSLPPDLGAVYHQRHLSPETVECREFLARSADLIYCSTKPLERLMREKFSVSNTTSGIYCGYPDPTPPMDYRESRVIGYMGTKSHLRDIAPAFEGVYVFLSSHPDWRLELMGDFADLSHPAAVSGQIKVIPPVRDYVEFRRVLAGCGWQVGLLPLLPDRFNEVKAPTKFIEYTASGMVTLATPFGPYKELVESSASIGISDWREIGGKLEDEESLRATFLRARDYCSGNFATQRLSEQVRQIITG